MRRHRNERLAAFFRDRPDLGIAAVWLFESWAAGRPPWEGQLGLGVLVVPRRHPNRRSRVALRELLEAELPEAAEDPVADLVMLDDAPPRTGRRIVTEGHRLLLRDPEIEHAYLRDVQLRAADLDVFLHRTKRVAPRSRVSLPSRALRIAR